MKISPGFFFSFLAVFLLMAIYFYELMVPMGQLVGNDAYMRMVRIDQLMETGNWFDQVIRRDNTPWGAESHWSRPVDMIIVGLGYLLYPFVAWPTAIFWAAVLFSPLMMIGAFLAIDDIASHYLDQDGRMLALILFFCSAMNFSYFAAGRPDHHSLILSLVLLALAAAHRAMVDPEPMRWWFLAGLATAVGEWVSIEVMLAWICISGVFAAQWWQTGKQGNRIATYQVVHFICSLVFLLAETPQGLLQEFWLDRLSGVYLFFQLVVTLGSCLLAGLTITQPTRRLITGLVVLMAIGLITFGVFPSLRQGPFGQVNRELKEVWLDQVGELRPLVPDLLSVFSGMINSLPLFVPGLITLPVLWKKIDWKNRQQTIRLFCWLVMAILFTFLAFRQTRWCLYANVFWLPPTVAGLKALFQKVEATRYARLVWAGTLILMLAGPVALGLFVGGFKDPPKDLFGEQFDPDSLPAVSVILETQAQNDPRPLRLLNFIDDGPTLLYTTPYDVTASPYHRNEQGNLDTFHIFSQPDSETSRQILEQRGITTALVGENEARYYRQAKNQGTLFEKLRALDPPSGFHYLGTGTLRKKKIHIFRYSAATADD